MGMKICPRILLFEEGQRTGYKIVLRCHGFGDTPRYKTYFMEKLVEPGEWLISNRCSQIEYWGEDAFLGWETRAREIEYAIHVFDEPACALTFFLWAAQRYPNQASILEVICHEKDLIGTGYFRSDAAAEQRFLHTSTWHQVYANKILTQEELCARSSAVQVEQAVEV